MGNDIAFMRPDASGSSGVTIHLKLVLNFHFPLNLSSTTLERETSASPTKSTCHEYPPKYLCRPRRIRRRIVRPDG